MRVIDFVVAGSLVVAAGAAASASFAQGSAGSHSFTLEAKPAAPSIASFSELQGITTKIDVIEHQGSRELMLRDQPAGTLIRLNAASLAGGDLESWWKQSASGKQTKKTLVLGLWDHVSGAKAKAKRRCGFTLHDAKIRGLAKRTIVRDGKKIQVADVELAPAKISHDCAELFRHPRDRKSK